MKRGAALAWSIALHAVVLYGLSRMTWGFVEPARVRPGVVVWLRNPPPSVKPANRGSGRAARRRAPAPRAKALRPKHPADKAAARSPPQAPSAARPSRRASGSSAPALAAARRTEAAAARRQSAAAPGRRASGGKSGAADLVQLRERAVAAVLQQRRRERGYMTFSLRDLPKRGPGAGIPGPKPPKTNVFRYGPQEARDSGHVLAYNRPARSKIGRWLADACHALTGGGLGVSIGMFALSDVCAESHAHGDLFESIKPDYLKRAPLPAARPAQLAEAGQALALQTEPASVP